MIFVMRKPVAHSFTHNEIRREMVSALVCLQAWSCPVLNDIWRNVVEW